MSRLFPNNSPLLPHATSGFRKTFFLFCWITLAVLLILYAIRPIRDPDFWWHLKTGDVIIQHNGLPQFDPFNYTGDGVVRSFQAVVLYGYWLWEISASLLFRAFGFSGIIFLKIATAALLSWAVLLEMRRRCLSQLTMIGLTGMGALVVINVYHLERPQVFSLLFATLLIGMISRIRTGHTPTLMLIPLMIFWANIHRGFVIGDILLVLAAAGFLIQYRHDRKRQLLMTSWAVAGILASFVNPTGWSMIFELCETMRHSVGPAHVSEYRSSWQLFLLQSRSAAVCLWTLAALHLAGLVIVSRRFWPEIFISLFIIAIGLGYIRNTGFIAISLLPLTGWYLEHGYARLIEKIPRYVKGAACAVIVAAISWATLGEWREWRSPHGPISNKFPVTMASFLKNSGLSGRLFNDYNAGGYLDWALYPEWKTFIDGRELDTRVSNQYLKIASGSMELVDGRPYYQLMLDRYRIDVVALRIALLDGRIQPLLKLLLQHSQWIPVYLDDQSFVLVRDTPKNAAAIQRYGMRNSDFLDMLTLLVDSYARRAPQAVHLSVMYADLLMYRGKWHESGSLMRQLEGTQLSPELRGYLDEQYRRAPRQPLRLPGDSRQTG